MASKGQSNMKYKTMMCKHYKSDQGCQYGEKCQFAHGQEELRMSQGMPVIHSHFLYRFIII